MPHSFYFQLKCAPKIPCLVINITGTNNVQHVCANQCNNLEHFKINCHSQTNTIYTVLTIWNLPVWIKETSFHWIWIATNWHKLLLLLICILSSHRSSSSWGKRDADNRHKSWSLSGSFLKNWKTNQPVACMYSIKVLARQILITTFFIITFTLLSQSPLYPKFNTATSTDC
jgi:hypothetical protein